MSAPASAAKTSTGRDHVWSVLLLSGEAARDRLGDERQAESSCVCADALRLIDRLIVVGEWIDHALDRVGADGKRVLDRAIDEVGAGHNARHDSRRPEVGGEVHDRSDRCEEGVGAPLDDQADGLTVFNRAPARVRS